jgi:hypothetical protein
MASPPISRIRFLDLSGKYIVGPLEWKSALIDVDATSDDWRSIELSIQGTPTSVRVEHRFGQDRLLADWPLSGTGNYKVMLNIGSYAETRVITIRPRKINDAAYTFMIDDLQRRLPTSIAIGLQKAGGLSGIQLMPPEEGTLAQELVRLRRAVDGVEGVRPGLAAILHELAQDHYAVFRSHEPWVDRRAVRRPSPGGLVRALIRGHNLDDGGELIQVVDRRTEQTVDVYENRLVKLFAQQVRSHLYAVLAEVHRRPDPAFLHEAVSLRGRLDRACRLARFLDEVSLPTFLPLRLSMVLMKRDPYPAVLEGFLEFSRGLAVRLDDEVTDAPLENLPSLYQTWGTLIVLDALIKAALKAEFEIRVQRLCERRRSELFIRLLPDGKPLLELVRSADGATLRFISELSIGSNGRYTSESFTQRPDILIEVQQENQSQLLLFDPKYKLDSEISDANDPGAHPKKGDIDKMHAYRDSIRDASAKRVVSFASILYPGPTIRYGDGIAALKAMPGEDDELTTCVGGILATALSRSHSTPQ